MLARAQWPLGPCRMGRAAALARAEVCDQLFDQRRPPGEVPGVAGKLSRAAPSRSTTGLVSAPPFGSGRAGAGPRAASAQFAEFEGGGRRPVPGRADAGCRRRRPEPRSAGLRWRTRASGVPTHARAARLPAPSVPPPPPLAARPPSRGRGEPPPGLGGALPGGRARPHRRGPAHRPMTRLSATPRPGAAVRVHGPGHRSDVPARPRPRAVRHMPGPACPHRRATHSRPARSPACRRPAPGPHPADARPPAGRPPRPAAGSPPPQGMDQLRHRGATPAP